MPLYHHHQPEPQIKDRMNTYFYVVYANFQRYPFGYMSQKTESKMLFQSSIIQLLRFMVNYRLSFFFLSVRYGISRFRLLRQPICFKDSLFCVLVVKSNYLSYCCLSINLNWPDHSFTNSFMRNGSLLIKLPLTEISFIFWPFSVILEIVEHE